MADAKITQLPTATTPAGTELAEIVQGGVNKKVTLQEIADLAAGIQSIVAGTNVTVDDSDPLNPIVSASGGGSGTVESVTGDGVDNTDPDNPVLSFPEADEVVFTPAGNISATDVQAALEELDSDIALKADFLLTLRTETDSHTLDATDLASINAGANLKIKMNVGSANTLTIPLNSSQAFPIGTQILVQWYGAGQTSIAATGGVTINSANGWVKLAYRYSSVVLSKVGTNEWDVEGALTA